MSCRKWEIQILRWSDGELDQGAEASLLRHLASCVHCRTMAEKSSELDGLFSKSPEPGLPHFLKENIVATVSEAMREDSMRGTLSSFFNFFTSLRQVVVGAVLMAGIGLGVVTGWNLAESMSGPATVSSYDLLSLAGLEGSGTGSSLEFIWTDSNGRTGR